MAGFKLMNGEVILLKSVGRIDFRNNCNQGDLVLTNFNIYAVEDKGIFAVKEVATSYPLSQISVYNNEPRIMVTGNFLLKHLEIYMGNDVMLLTLSTLNTQELQRWETTIRNILRNHQMTSSEQRSHQSMFAPNSTMENSTNSFKEQKFERQINQPEKVMKKCCSCSAPLTGYKGQSITCEYCDTEQIL